MNWLLFQNLGLVLALTMIAVLIQAWLWRKVGHERLRGNHEVAGFVYAVVGSIFAVNVALALDTVHDEFVNGSRATMQEAIHLEGIHRMAGWLEVEQRDRIRGAVVVYAKAVVDREWGERIITAGKPNNAVAEYETLWQSLRGVEPKTAGQQAAYAEILSRTDSVDAARQSRLHAGIQGLPTGIRVLQWMGGMITVGFGLFFTMENRRAHILLLLAVSLLVWGNLIVLDTVRFPFNGFSFAEPSPFLQLLGRVAR